MVTLRALQIDDLNLVYEWENNPELWSVSEQKGPFSLAEIESFVEKCIDQCNYEINRLIIVYETKAIGAVDFFEMNQQLGECGIGIFISEKKYRNRGCATSALQLALSHLRRLGIRKIEAIIYEDNRPSTRLFLGAGFKPNSFEIYQGKSAIRFSLSH